MIFPNVLIQADEASLDGLTENDQQALEKSVNEFLAAMKEFEGATGMNTRQNLRRLTPQQRFSWNHLGVDSPK